MIGDSKMIIWQYLRSNRPKVIMKQRSISLLATPQLTCPTNKAKIAGSSSLVKKLSLKENNFLTAQVIVSHHHHLEVMRIIQILNLRPDKAI